MKDCIDNYQIKKLNSSASMHTDCYDYSFFLLFLPPSFYSSCDVGRRSFGFPQKNSYGLYLYF